MATGARSVHIGRRVIQQTVAHLGELDEVGRLRARAPAHALIGAPGQAELFNDGMHEQTVAVRLRCVTSADAAQAALLDRLGIALPKRIRLPELAADATERAAA